MKGLASRSASHALYKIYIPDTCARGVVLRRTASNKAIENSSGTIGLEVKKLAIPKLQQI